MVHFLLHQHLVNVETVQPYAVFRVSPLHDRADGAQGFPCSAYCGIPLQHPLACVNQPKVLATSESFHIAITTSISVTKMAR